MISPEELSAARMEERRFTRSLVARKGKSALFIMEAAGTLSERSALVADADRLLAAHDIKAALVELSGTLGLEQLLEKLEALAAKGVQTVHLVGAEEWLKQRDPWNDWTATRMDLLNIQRENLFKIPSALLMWLSPPAISDFATQALDLWAWRSGGYQLAPEKSPEAVPAPPLAKFKRARG